MKSGLQELALPRPVGSENHVKVRELLVKMMQEAALKPIRGDTYALPYHSNGKFANLVGMIPGSDPELPPIVMGAHYDSVRGTPGADDNAAALLMILQAIEDLKPGTLKRDLIVAYFDAGEAPYVRDPLKMGSIVFYGYQLQRPLHCALVFDLVGHDIQVPVIKDVMFVMGSESHYSFLQPLTVLPQDTGIRIVPTLARYIGDISDHHIFRIKEEPYLFFSSGRWEHYHKAGDTVEGVNPQKVDALAVYINRFVRACDSLEFPKKDGARDTIQLELNAFNTVLGDVLRAIGMYPLASRKDLDKAVGMMLSKFKF